MEMLVAETGGSKRDIYRLFGDKRSLFLQVVTTLSDEGAFTARVDAASTSIETGLATIARSFLDFLLSQRGLDFHRLMVADAARLEETGRAFIRYGPAATYRAVADYLRARFGAERLPQEDAEQGARIFVDSVSADLQLRALLGDVASRAERERRIDIAVRVFDEGMRRVLDDRCP